MAKILIVDDDPVCGDFLTRFLRRDGHEATLANTGQQAVDLGMEQRPDFLICDWLLKDTLDGLDVAKALCNALPDMRVIFMSGLPADQIVAHTDSLPVLRVLEKPLSIPALLEEVRREMTASGAESRQSSNR